MELIPAPVMAEARERAETLAKCPTSLLGAAVIVLLWLAVVVILVGAFAWRRWQP